jgi:2-keto-4-pentenoate hydratase
MVFSKTSAAYNEKNNKAGARQVTDKVNIHPRRGILWLLGKLLLVVY